MSANSNMERRAALFWSVRISLRVSASYKVMDQNSLLGTGWGTRERSTSREPSKKAPVESRVFSQ